MNESDTRLHKIDPKLKAAGWGTVEGSRITTEYTFTKGKISQTMKGKPKRADYLLIYKGVKLAVVEAKSDELSYSEGVGQAKEYADMLGIRYTYATNGNDIYEDTERTVPFVLFCASFCACGRMPDFFTSSEDLHRIWSDPETREALLDKMADAGYGKDILRDIRRIIDAEQSDLLDVLEYIAYATTPIERRERAERIKEYTESLSDAQRQFVEYLITAYIKAGVDELRMDKLKTLLELKFGSVVEGISALGGVPVARQTFKDFQRHLYA